jgi:hypothetical protein
VGWKRLKPEAGTGAVRVVGGSLLATKRVAVEEMKKAEGRMKKARSSNAENRESS